MCFVSCVSHAFASVHCCLVVTCWEMAELLALVGDVLCNFVTFPCDILCQVWYLIVLFHDLCSLSNLVLSFFGGPSAELTLLKQLFTEVENRSDQIDIRFAQLGRQVPFLLLRYTSLILHPTTMLFITNSSYFLESPT